MFSAGLTTIGLEAEGLKTCTLTVKAQVVRQFSMGDAAVVNAIPDAVETRA